MRRIRQKRVTKTHQMAVQIKEKCPEEFREFSDKFDHITRNEMYLTYKTFCEKCPEEMAFFFKRAKFYDGCPIISLMELYDKYCPEDMKYLDLVHKELSNEQLHEAHMRMDEKAPEVLISYLTEFGIWESLFAPYRDEQLD